MAEEKKMSLAAKLAAIGKDVGAVGKSGTNRDQGYNFIEYAAVAGKIRELFDKYKIIIIPCVEDVEQEAIVTKNGTHGYHYMLRMKFTIINGDEPGDNITTSWLGESSAFDDKGVNKAETSGMKYFLMRLFNISEKGDEDADASSPGKVVESQSVAKKIYRKAIDFKEVSKHLSEIKTQKELVSYWNSLGLTKRQAETLQPDFAKKRAELQEIEEASDGVDG